MQPSGKYIIYSFNGNIRMVNRPQLVQMACKLCYTSTARYCNMQSTTKLWQYPVASIWFEIWGFVDPGKKKIDFPRKYCPFTATSGQIILFLIKSHHFRTYFLYLKRYNISRPVHDPPPPSHQNLGVTTPKPPGLTPLALPATIHCRHLYSASSSGATMLPC